MRVTILAVLILTAVEPAGARANTPTVAVFDVEALRGLVRTNSPTVVMVELGAEKEATEAVRQVLEQAGHQVRQAAPAAGPTEVDAPSLCRTHGTEVVIVVEGLTGRHAVARVLDAQGVSRGVVLVGPFASVPAPALVLEAYEGGALGVDAEGPYQGRDHRRLTWEDFYRITGRPDLVQAQSNLKSSRQVLGGVGGVALGVGVIWGIVDVAATLLGAVYTPVCVLDNAARSRSAGTIPSQDPCPAPQASGLPWVMAAAGGGMLLAVPLVPRQASSLESARELASVHNQQLRRRFSPTVEAAPLLGPGTGGLLLQGRF
jgi:hypothetical protein